MSARKVVEPSSILVVPWGQPTPTGSSNMPQNFTEGSGVSSENRPHEKLPVSLATSNLLALLGPQSVRFPTFFELVKGVTEQPASPQSATLFQVITEPQTLYSSLLEDPKRYEEGVAELLQLIIGGKKKYEELPLEQRHLLDRAAFEFAQVQRKKPKSLAPKARPKPIPKEEIEPEIEYHESQTRGVPDGGGSISTTTKPPTFWWLKK